ncbi:MAG: hypothetical protein ACOYLB_11400 [Phototrophicaceae bacterium]
MWLVVEDDMEIFEILQVIFEFWRVESMGFSSQEDVFNWLDQLYDPQYLQTLPVLPEIAVLDLRLGNDFEGGIHVAQRIRQTPVIHDIPIVFVTVYYLSPLQREYILEQSGANLIFDRKPTLRDADFRQQVSHLVETYRQSHPPTP